MIKSVSEKSLAIVSRSDALKVAVGFSPREEGDNHSRRVATLEKPVADDFQASLRDATLRQSVPRGMNPTATIRTSLREDEGLLRYGFH